MGSGELRGGTGGMGDGFWKRETQSMESCFDKNNGGSFFKIISH